MKKAVRLLGVSVSGFVEEETDAPAQIALELIDFGANVTDGVWVTIARYADFI
jgi:hypothetical protein